MIVSSMISYNLIKVCMTQNFFIHLLGIDFKLMKDGIYFIVNYSILGCRVIQDFDLCKLEDL